MKSPPALDRGRPAGSPAADRNMFTGSPDWHSADIGTQTPSAETPAGRLVGGSERHRNSPLQRLIRQLGGSSAIQTLIGAATLTAIAFTAGGGLELGATAKTEIAITIGSALLVSGCLLAQARRGGSRPAYGRWPVILLFCFALLSGVSIAWAVEPNASWQEAGRMLSYAFFFAAICELARAFPGRWPVIIGSATLAGVAISSYALLTKILPDQLAATETYARLQAPYGYWIATGLTAAMGALGCLWLGARRDGHALLRLLAFPALGIELVTLMLTYSRGPIAALMVGVALWLAIVPLRLRSIALLASAAICAAGVVAYAFATHALSSEGVSLAARSSAGHQLGTLVLAMLLALGAIGATICFETARRPPAEGLRRRAGIAMLGSLLALSLMALGALSLSHRGLSGTISHSLEALTNPSAKLPANTPGRFTAIANARARYWKESFEVFEAEPLLGSGGEGYATARLRYRTDSSIVRQAHGFIVQTLADLGLAGLALTLALFLGWAVAAGRSTHPFNRSWRGGRWRRLTDARGRPAAYSGERIAMLGMLCIVCTFGVHSLVDWTWYVPGDACVALLCAAWLAGRGPLQSAERHGRRQTGPPSQTPRSRLLPAALTSGVVLIAAALTVVTQLGPLRAEEAGQRALAQLPSEASAALASARAAVTEDPLSAQARLTLAAVQRRLGSPAAARATLSAAVVDQPANPALWQALGEFDATAGNYSSALPELRAAIFLNPMAAAPESEITQSPELISLRNAYISALRATGD